MGVAKSQVVAVLSSLPNDVVSHLIDEYQEIKQQFAFRRFRPSELTGGRFAECVLRLIQHLSNPPYTPFGVSLPNTDKIIKQAENNTNLSESMRLFIPRMARILLDVRNRRDVAHVGGNVSPNYSDSLFICHSVDWIMTEIIRLHYKCPIDVAVKIVESLNEVSIPIIADIDGYIRVQNTTLKTKEKVLAILYHKNPGKVPVESLIKWTKYSNPSKFKKEVLGFLNNEALIHYEGSFCSLLPRGIMYVEKNISMELFL